VRRSTCGEARSRSPLHLVRVPLACRCITLTLTHPPSLMLESPTLSPTLALSLLTAGAIAIFSALAFIWSIATDPSLATNSAATLLNQQHGKDVKATVDTYEGMFKGSREDVGKNTTAAIEHREKECSVMISSFYDLVADFYKYGWGSSFHFAPRFAFETFMESIYRAEYFLSARLGLTAGMKVIDVGCGVGGPLRNIARFSGSDITGVAINQYQVEVGNKYSAGEQNRVSE